MKPYLKYIFIGVTVLLVFLIYLYKPEKNVTRTEPVYSMGARPLFLAFDQDEAVANERYLNQVIQVTGKVREVQEDDEGLVTVTLDTGNDFFGVACELQKASTWKKEDFKAGQEVTFKGLCTGMAVDVVLVRCIRIS